MHCACEKTCPGCWLSGLPYGLIMRLRGAMYRVGLLKSHAAPRPTLCVGNITTGGTGKTPMVAWLCKQLRDMGRTPAILTRGYKAVDGVSEEAELLKSITNCPVYLGADRWLNAQRAAEAGANVLVMDDGFQHLQLRRDLDIVLVDAIHPFGAGGCLPLGRLREPKRGLKRAGAIVMTRSDQISPADLDHLEQTLRRLAPQAVIARAKHAPSELIGPDGQSEPPEMLAGRKVVLASGIGNPAAFEATVQSLGATILEHVILPDHATFDDAQITQIGRAVQIHRPEMLIITAKDGVKLSKAPTDWNLWRLNISMQITDGEEPLLGCIRKIL